MNPLASLSAAAAALLLLGACTAPEIADWPPRAPEVDEDVIQQYVDIYGNEPTAPVYGPADIDALNLLTRRQLRNDAPDSDIERLRRELDGIRADMEREPAPPKAMSKTEINTIKRRARQRFDSHHDQRMEMKKHGL